jgi:hypothetical protein
MPKRKLTPAAARAKKAPKLAGHLEGEPEGDCWVFSIDVGIVNVGAALMNAKTGDVAFADRLQLAPSLRAMAKESEITPRVFKLFFDEGSPYRRMIDKARIVLIEQQMTSKQKLIQYTIGAYCLMLNKPYRYVGPKSIKAFYNTGKFSRRAAGKAVRGKKENHAANKKAAIALAKAKWPSIMAGVGSKKQDDVADALLQASWFREAHQQFGFCC